MIGGELGDGATSRADAGFIVALHGLHNTLITRERARQEELIQEEHEELVTGIRTNKDGIEQLEYLVMVAEIIYNRLDEER